jgi:glycosyltransferase involved in cell wall biosynthesis
MNCLHIVHSLDRGLGGVVTAATGMCQALAKDGCSVELLASQSQSDELQHLESEYRGPKPQLLPRSFPARFFNSYAIGPWLAEHATRFDIVSLHGVFTGVTWQAYRALRQQRVPYLLHAHGALDPFDLRKKRWAKGLLGPLYLRNLMNQSKGVMFTTELEAERAQLFGSRATRYVAPLSVSPLPPAGPNARRRFRMRHGIPQDALVVLFLGRVDYKKGLQWLLPALLEAKKANRDLWFVVAGSFAGAFGVRVRTRLQSGGFSDWTSLVGFLSGSEKTEAFQAADLFALPSANENFGITVVEALQAGLPILISDEVYIYREIKKHDACAVCKPNYESCRDRLVDLVSDNNQRSQLAARASSAAERLFSVQVATERLKSIYGQVLSGA